MNELESKELFLVEDNPADAKVLMEAFVVIGFNPVIQIANAAKGALDFLYRRNGFENARRPHLILLDVNLPDGDGLSILETIRKDASLKDIKVVVYTGQKSQLLADKIECKGAIFKPKPQRLEAFIKLARELSDFWSRP